MNSNILVMITRPLFPQIHPNTPPTIDYYEFINTGGELYLEKSYQLVHSGQRMLGLIFKVRGGEPLNLGNNGVLGEVELVKIPVFLLCSREVGFKANAP